MILFESYYTIPAHERHRFGTASESPLVPTFADAIKRTWSAKIEDSLCIKIYMFSRVYVDGEWLWGRVPPRRRYVTPRDKLIVSKPSRYATRSNITPPCTRSRTWLKNNTIRPKNKGLCVRKRISWIGWDSRPFFRKFDPVRMGGDVRYHMWIAAYVFGNSNKKFCDINGSVKKFFGFMFGMVEDFNIL